MAMSKYGWVFLKGMGMGAADVVPGVSGGTVAFITGIYDELIDSLKSANPKAVMILFKEGPAAFWSYINGSFLLALIGGVIASFLSLAHIITSLMASHPLLLWSFFFGLVAASAVHIGKEIHWRSPLPLLVFAIGLSLAWLVTSGTPVQVEPSHWKVFGAGAIAICAMILPGISGSFILLLLGLYGFILESVKMLNIEVLAFFMLGCLTGLLSFVHLLSWLLHHYRAVSIALLTGFLVGSLNALWPWKHVLEFYESRKGLKPLVQENVLPADYAALTGNEPMLFACILLAVAGVLLVLGLERLSDTSTDA